MCSPPLASDLLLIWGYSESGYSVTRAYRNLCNSAIPIALFSLAALMSANGQSDIAPIKAELVKQAELENVISHMTEVQYRNRQAIRAYVVTREYKLFGDKSDDASSQVLAEVSFVPPGSKQYAIKGSQGSGRGEKVVKKVLEHEREMAGDWEDTALTERNYSFHLLGEEILDGRRCFVLAIDPKRDSKDLIRGKAWIDAESYNTHLITGRPAKSPSWWVKRVQLSLSFGNVNGMWLQTGATASADVRLFGKHVLTAKDVRYTTAEIEAHATPPRKPRQAQRAIGAVVLSR